LFSICSDGIDLFREFEHLKGKTKMNLNQYVGIEGGGTKFVCVHGSGPHDLRDRTVINTQSPHATMKEVIEYIRAVKQRSNIKAIGLAVFGPLDLDHSSPTYGYITTTPKPGWGNFNIVGELKQAFDMPIGFDTDVNGAALGEYQWGAAQSLNDFIYITVGTGIGGGLMINGKIVHGAMHPEMGHIIIPQDTSRDSFKGCCQFHSNCWESLASGTAMNARWQVESAMDLSATHEAWNLEAHYLGIGIANLILTLSPQRILIGGGVMHQSHLLPKVRAEVAKCLNGYLKCEKIINRLDEYIVKPGLDDNSGICGAIALAEQSLKRMESRSKVQSFV
jgi:fructokinase